MSHASFEVAAAKVKPPNLRTGQFPDKTNGGEHGGCHAMEGLTDSQQSMLRFNQAGPESKLQRHLLPLIKQHCHLTLTNCSQILRARTTGAVILQQLIYFTSVRKLSCPLVAGLWKVQPASCDRLPGIFTPSSKKKAMVPCSVQIIGCSVFETHYGSPLADL